jgi:site-specific DNA-methyltransferase (adenine-specific)
MVISEVYNIDCMEYMKNIPDKFFNLAIVDPQYGIGEDGKSNHSRGKLAKAKQYTPKHWDNEPMSPQYFKELFRVSKNQIIWGANHFITRINKDSPCWIVWDKDNGASDFADCELAFTSFPNAVRKFKYRWNGMLQENMKNKEIRIHPTQKPVDLYAYLLKTFAKEGDKIFDSHLGSGSSRIAAYKLGFDFYGCEIDKEYFASANERFERECLEVIQTKNEVFTQQKLF